MKAAMVIRTAIEEKHGSTMMTAECPIGLQARDPGLRGFHPSGSRIQNRCCDTVVFVRVGEDAYLDYALRGGP